MRIGGEVLSGHDDHGQREIAPNDPTNVLDVTSRDEDLFEQAMAAFQERGFSLSVQGSRRGGFVASVADTSTRVATENWASGPTMLDAAFAAEQRLLVEQGGAGVVPGETYLDKARERQRALQLERRDKWTDTYARGTVKFFRSEKGWGGIESDETPGDVWVHFGQIDEDDPSLNAGDAVEFRYEASRQDSWRYVATWVRRLHSPDATPKR
jgi:cold shock protein